MIRKYARAAREYTDAALPWLAFKPAGRYLERGTMTHYLVRTEEDGMFTSHLEFFEDDQEGPGELTATQNLVMYLKRLLLLNHCTGIGPAIRLIRRINDDDTLEELSLVFLRTQPEGKVYDDYYQVIVKDTLEDVARFSVRFS